MFSFITGCSIALLLGVSVCGATPVELASNGQALLPVVVSPAASPEVRRAADELAQYLGKITGATFEVVTGDGAAGIAVGTLNDWAEILKSGELDATDPTRREQYVLRSHGRGLWLIGATDAAATHAVWDLLHRLGHRHFFPTQNWEITPHAPTLAVEVDAVEAPDFLVRHIYPGGGLFDYDRDPIYAWRRHNRHGQSLIIPTSHIYDTIILRRRADFDAHPEYLALRNGQRVKIEGEGVKFCIANADLRRLVVDWACQYLEQKPNYDGVSMEPSDGGDWCECEPCAALGTITDRVVTLANEVAAALEARLPQRKYYVGMLAYGYHSPPPSAGVELHPNVVVSVANGFLRGGWEFEELAQAWGQRASMLGVYEYLGVVQWSWDRPGRGRATRKGELAQRIAHAHRAGVRLFTGESEGNWGPAGFGYYLCARALWDVEQTDRVEELHDEFLQLCFGPAVSPMRRFYQLIDGDTQPLLSRDLVGRMYRALDEALRLTGQPDVRARLSDLALYTRYVEMYLDYQESAGEARQENYEKLIRFVWQSRRSLMVHAHEIYRQLDRFDKNVTVPAEAHYRQPERTNPWKQNPELTPADVDRFVREGIERNALTAFKPVTFSRDLAPAAPLGLTSPVMGDFGPGTQNYQSFQTWVSDPAQPVRLRVTGGLIKHYRDRGDARIKLFRGQQKIDEARVPPDGEERTVELRAQLPGVHRIEVTDGGDRTRVRWDDGWPMTLWSDQTSRTRYTDSWTLCFYVPRGTDRVAGYTDSATGQLLDASGAVALDFEKLPGAGFFDVAVPAGSDGQLWTFRGCRGQRVLMTVPPGLARSGAELLLPAEVIAADLENKP